MTQHNIARSEAFEPSAHVEIRVARRRRPLHPAVKMCGAAFCAGMGVSLVDVVIGAPVCLGIASLAFIVLWIWPSH